MDIRAEACLLTSKVGPREVKDNHRNHLIPEPWPGDKKCHRECRNLKKRAHFSKQTEIFYFLKTHLRSLK